MYTSYFLHRNGKNSASIEHCVCSLVISSKSKINMYGFFLSLTAHSSTNFRALLSLYKAFPSSFPVVRTKHDVLVVGSYNVHTCKLQLHTYAV